MIAAAVQIENRNVVGEIGRQAMIGWKKLKLRAVKGDKGEKTGKER